MAASPCGRHVKSHCNGNFKSQFNGNFKSQFNGNINVNSKKKSRRRVRTFNCEHDSGFFELPDS
ncbi:hypothetical protein SAMN04515620_13744 [Collimonas sp. OK607]|nr:hypothetical protein SAMN04515620_13744 [Collimonas sp. OK607]